LVSLLSGVVTLGSYKLLFDTNGYFSNEKSGLVTMASNSYGKEWAYQLMFLTLLRLPKNNSFRCSRKNVSRTTVSNPILEYFMGIKGGQSQEQVGTGSGVIISEDGYIVTNNHVIKDASKLKLH
jgi:S1-C subfamily serine protease